ncbi:MAG: hypothetical protein GX491_10905 [Chloroflexi bacterium]|nr:hypothetical protein [Chloroflexota bacterium]
MNIKRWLALAFWTSLLLMLCYPLPESQTALAQPASTPQAELQAASKKMFFPVVTRQNYVHVPPLPSTSYYMTTVDPALSYQEGCKAGTRDRDLPGVQDSVVILDYGIPRERNGVLGASGMWRTGFVTLEQIAVSVQNFGLGYYNCTGSDWQSRIIIGIGTNNYNTGVVTRAHGEAWAEMVNAVNEWFTNRGVTQQVIAVGANDIELAWNSPGITREWLEGYDSKNQYPLYNFGALDGCPRFAAPDATCGSYGYYPSRVWTKEQVWYAIWGSPPVYPLPEIYARNGVNAEQWYLMSDYAIKNHGQAIQFIGVMTTYGACQQVGGCNGIDNRPEEGWNQLTKLIMGTPHTAVGAPRYSTDIIWYGE